MLDEDFEESIKEFFEPLKLQDYAPLEGPRTLLRPLVDPENIIPCDNFYTNLSLFLLVYIERTCGMEYGADVKGEGLKDCIII